MSEALLAKDLIDHGRYFYKPMHYDAKACAYPNFLLTDQGDVSVPIEIGIDGGVGAALQNARIAQYLEDGRDYILRDCKSEQTPPDMTRRVSA